MFTNIQRIKFRRNGSRRYFSALYVTTVCSLQFRKRMNHMMHEWWYPFYIIPVKYNCIYIFLYITKIQAMVKYTMCSMVHRALLSLNTSLRVKHQRPGVKKIYSYLITYTDLRIVSSIQLPMIRNLHGVSFVLHMITLRQGNSPPPPPPPPPPPHTHTHTHTTPHTHTKRSNTKFWCSLLEDFETPWRSCDVTVSNVVKSGIYAKQKHKFLLCDNYVEYIVPESRWIL